VDAEVRRRGKKAEHLGIEKRHDGGGHPRHAVFDFCRWNDLMQSETVFE